MSDSFEGWTFEQLGNTFVKLDRVEATLRAQTQYVPHDALDGWITGVADLKRQILEKIQSLPGGEFINPEMLRLNLEHSMAPPPPREQSQELVKLIGESAGPPVWTAGLSEETLIAGYEATLPTMQLAWQTGGLGNANDAWADLMVAEFTAVKDGQVIVAADATGELPVITTPVSLIEAAGESAAATGAAAQKSNELEDGASDSLPEDPEPDGVYDAFAVYPDPVADPNGPADGVYEPLPEATGEMTPSGVSADVIHDPEPETASPEPLVPLDIPPTDVALRTSIRAREPIFNLDTPPSDGGLLVRRPALDQQQPGSKAPAAVSTPPQARPRSTVPSLPALMLGVLTVAIALGAYCALGGFDSSSDPQQSLLQVFDPAVEAAGQQPAAPTQAAPVATPTLLTADQLRGIAITRAEIAPFFGSCTFQYQVENGTDAAQAVSSSPQLSQTMRTLGLRAVYNSAAATAPCSTLAVQSLVTTADVATVQTVYRELTTVYPTLFTNVRTLPNMSNGWDESYCQDGVFASNNSRWLVCFMREATYLGTIIVGFPPANTVPAGQTINVDATQAQMRSFGEKLYGRVTGAYGSTPSGTTSTVPNYSSEILAALPQYEQAARDGDGRYFLDHLFPMVTTFYTQERCAQFFNNLGKDPSFKIEPVSISTAGPWTFSIYGETVGNVPDAYTVRVKLTQQGNSTEASMHVGWDAQQKKLLVASPCRRPS